jgi:hypothetical protein
MAAMFPMLKLRRAKGEPVPATLNRLFLEQGATGEMGRITAQTVLRGEQTWAAKRSDEEPE